MEDTLEGMGEVGSVGLGDGGLSCTCRRAVHYGISEPEFATQVSWQKIDECTGATIEEEYIIDGSETPGGGGDNGSGDLEG